MMVYRTVMVQKKVQKFIHMVLHLIAITMGIIGIYAVFKFHNASGIANMYSLHSWLGIVTFCLYGLQVTSFLCLCWSAVSKWAIVDGLFKLSIVLIDNPNRPFITPEITSILINKSKSRCYERLAPPKPRQCAIGDNAGGLGIIRSFIFLTAWFLVASPMNPKGDPNHLLRRGKTI